VKFETKNVLTGLITMIDGIDPIPMTFDEIKQLQKEELKQRITNRAVVELIKILIQKNVIIKNDFSAELRIMIDQYNAL